ncbi:hypothetical protein [Mesorhizobium sp. A623]
MAVLRALPRGEGYIFDGVRKGRPIGNSAMRSFTGAAGCTVHGFRSSFRDWAGEETSHPREIAEWSLGHKVGGEVERAYRRGDALEKRRQLMGEWATYCAS